MLSDHILILPYVQERSLETVTEEVEREDIVEEGEKVEEGRIEEEEKKERIDTKERFQGEVYCGRRRTSRYHQTGREENRKGQK